MGLPTKPVTLTVEQLSDLNRRLSNLRHDINNNLSVIVAATELIRHRPQIAEGMMAKLAEQPAKISDSINRFTIEFERTFGITRM
jgi:hypothetical protein